MTFIRWFLGKIILFFDAAFAPKTRQLDPTTKRKIAESTANLSVYQYLACPFCVKVRRFLKAEGIEIPFKDAKTEPSRNELLKGGGKLQVPCLHIVNSDGSQKWLYESTEIISYFKKLLPTS